MYIKFFSNYFFTASVIVTIGVSIPPLIGWCEYTYTPRQYICFANWPQSLSYALFMICCCFGIPLSVMIVCNYKIYKQVKLSRNKIKDAYTIRMSKGEEKNYSTTISENISQSSTNNSINEIVQHYKGMQMLSLTTVTTGNQEAQFTQLLNQWKTWNCEEQERQHQKKLDWLEYQGSL